MKPSSLIVEIRHHTGVDAANAIKVKQRGLIDFNPLPRAPIRDAIDGDFLKAMTTGLLISSLVLPDIQQWQVGCGGTKGSLKVRPRHPSGRRE
jgi:hypothetical protein